MLKGLENSALKFTQAAYTATMEIALLKKIEKEIYIRKSKGTELRLPFTTIFKQLSTLLQSDYCLPK